MPKEIRTYVIYGVSGIVAIIIVIVWLFTPLGALLNTMMAVIAAPSLLVYAIWSLGRFLKKRFFTKPVSEAPVLEKAPPVKKERKKKKEKKET